MIGTAGGTEDKKIDGNSNVQVLAGGSITLGSYIHNSGTDFRAHGTITVNGEIDRDLADRPRADHGLYALLPKGEFYSSFSTEVINATDPSNDSAAAWR